MPTKTYDLIASNVLSSSASSVTFSSIPATYRDLILVVNGIFTADGGSIFCRVNSDTAANYTNVNARGDGTSATSATDAANTSGIRVSAGVDPMSTSRLLLHIQILDYVTTDKHKTFLVRANNAASGGTSMLAGRWASTSAINSLTLISGVSSFTSGSTFYLYGIVS